MHGNLIKVSPSDIQPGMFLAELDRPWLDTPLLFQSFYVRDLADIDWIQQNCAYVLVDRGNSDSKLDQYFSDLAKQPCSSDSGWNVFPPRRSEEASATAGGSENRTRGPLTSLLVQLFMWLARVFGMQKPKSVATGEQRGKPIDREVLKRQITAASATYTEAYAALGEVMDALRDGGSLDLRMVETVVTDVVNSVLESTDAMTYVLQIKKADDYSYHHALATSIWAVVFGKALGFDNATLTALGTGGLLLDIGKSRVDPALLSMKGRLAQSQMAELQRHVDHGLKILQETGTLDATVVQMVQFHHERPDGSGYPAGLMGDDIPVVARIAGLVDTYHAMTSKRSYASAQSSFAVLRYLLENADRLFQAELVERFIQLVGVFPTASLVSLNTGEVGIVVEQNKLRRLRPKVMVVLDANKMPLAEFPIVDLASGTVDPASPDAVWIVDGLDPGSFGIDPREYFL
jgi:HD-GYP domain-containing protein (c-di-GMP phosphodiesterase class II)